jgi:hypothetical protein
MIERTTPVTQASVFTDNMPVPMKSFENGLDKLTEIDQEQSATLYGPEPANVVYAGPPGGTSQSPLFRALVLADLPAGTAGAGCTLGNLIPNGCTGATTAAGALVNLGAVSTATTVNGHALSSNVTVSASDLTTGTLPHAQLPTLLSGDIPNNAANTTGNAATATYATSAGTATDPTKLPLTGGTLTGALTGTSASFSGNVVAGSETLGSPLLPASGGTGATTAAGANLNITGVTQTGTLGTSSQVSTFPGTVASPQVVSLLCGGTNDAAAIAAAIAALPSAGGEIVFPSGVCATPTQINLSGRSDIIFKGQGGKGQITSELRYTGITAPFLNLGTTLGFKSEGLAITYNNASFTGVLINGDGSQNLLLEKGAIEGNGQYGASALISLNATADDTISDMVLQSAGYGITGYVSGSYSNVVKVANTTFNALTTCGVLDPGTSWTFDHVTFEALQNGNPCAITYTTGNVQANLVIGNGTWVGDSATPGATGAWFTLHPSGLVMSVMATLTPGTTLYKNGENGSFGGVFVGNSIYYAPSYTNQKVIDFGSTTALGFTVQGNSASLGASQISGSIPSDLWFCPAGGACSQGATSGGLPYLPIGGGTLTGVLNWPGGTITPGTNGACTTNFTRSNSSQSVLCINSSTWNVELGGGLSGGGDSNFYSYSISSTSSPYSSACNSGVVTGNKNAFQVTGITAGATSCTITFPTALNQGYCVANGAVGIVTTPTGAHNGSIVFGLLGINETTITAHCF